MARSSSIFRPFSGKRIVPNPRADKLSPFFGTVLYCISIALPDEISTDYSDTL
jgi:hypothetical protein